MRARLDPEFVPALMAYLGQAGLTLVDVGGRHSSLAQLLRLAPVARYVTCEPDRDAAATLHGALTAAGWTSVTVVPEAMASRRGDAPLHLTRGSGMSSLLEPDADELRHFPMGFKFEVTSTATVPLLPLDEAAAAYGFGDACFLKLDTQGTELDILRSGAALVRRSLVGVHVETLFRPFYRGQSLFADVDQFLRQQGFSLFTLSRTSVRRKGYQADSYSDRVTVWAHCLYLREIGALAGLERGPGALPQLLALALAFAQFDFAREVIDEIGRSGVAGTGFDAIRADVDRVIALATRKAVGKSSTEAETGVMLGAFARDGQVD